MKSKAVASLVVVSLLGSSVAAFAQPHGPDGRAPAYGRTDQSPPRGPDGRAPDYGRADQSPPSMERANRPAGAIPHRDWHRGDRLPMEYRDRNYTVDDWHQHGLSAPPRGYHWVGVNGDYVLAAIATGVITSIIMSGAR
ncbi:RcnB family protein [Paraburkholderia dinghuensis]|uniref:RcnB family protein n=1 Tax=Paraburkholderia dinghuensis TaxID=2305225 RepID=A0A3N6MTD7_9BURK|nr:RcnB family protein [Paraburkholderia dinghuensis]RQH01131.1 hypothetical protein D1Y85_23810 [Paraburkholderia dinghuensis]